MQALRQRANLVGRGDGFDEQDVGAGLAELLRALDRGLEAQRRRRVGAGHDEQVGVGAGIDGGLDLVDGFLGGDHLLAREMAAALGRDLVLELDAVGARALQHAHRVAHVQRVAEAGVGIDDQRQVHGVADARRVVGDLVQAHEALVGQAEPHVGDARAGDVNGFEAQVFDDARRQRVEGARHQHAAAGLGQGTEGLASRHRIFL
ncbi:hypothetical protein D9M72_512150 [compost metagenome]